MVLETILVFLGEALAVLEVVLVVVLVAEAEGELTVQCSTLDPPKARGR